jgi:hypothetical protein
MFIVAKLDFGLGNNLFRYMAGKIFQRETGLKFYHASLASVGVETHLTDDQVVNLIKRNKCFDVTEDNFDYALKNVKEIEVNYDAINLVGFFEKWDIFDGELDFCRRQLTLPNIDGDTDALTLHIRLQNRLVEKNNFFNLLSPTFYSNLIETVGNNKIKIVTDIEHWYDFSVEDLDEITRHHFMGPNPACLLVDKSLSMKYMDDLTKGLERYNPKICISSAAVMPGSGGLRGGQMEAFNEIFNSKQIFVHNSTFSWWAANLSAAEQIYVYGPWKPSRKLNHHSLGKTKFINEPNKIWKAVGTVDDTYMDINDFGDWDKQFGWVLWKNRILKLLRKLSLVKYDEFDTRNR